MKFWSFIHHRYEEVQNSAEELHQRLQQAEVDNHEMQRRLRNLDQELQNALNQNQVDFKFISLKMIL